MCLESQKGSPSYNDLASRHETVYNKSASKQAVNKKFNKSCVLFFQAVLANIIQSKLPEQEIEVLKKTDKYKRILVQDSTIIKLPLRLYNVFSGISNACASVCNARIQGVYDILSGTFTSFSIDSYSKNDLSVASDLELHRRDLTLRDRGYYLIKEVKRHLDEGADCIYRCKGKSLFFDTESGKIINLLKLLKRKGNIDIEVYLNDDYHTKVRLVAEPVSEDVANLRRMKAKKEYKRHKPSEETLALMSWTIFITTISKEQADFHKILKLYGLRWRIEIIFKSWKSNMEFSKVHNVSEIQLQILLTARFIMIVIYMHKIFNPWSIRISTKYKREISMIKFIKYLNINPEKTAELLLIGKKDNHPKIKIIDETLMRYCTYDKRKRLNFNQMVDFALS